MAYGRLDVFWPDGLFKTYLLTDSNISIGRSSGNIIPLETDSLSRYHATIVYEDGEILITDLDSANGTFVDGVRLKPNEPRTLYGGEELLIGELRMVYHYLDESPTRPITIPEEVTRRIEKAEAPFFIDLEEPEIGIPPGAHISARLTITNTSREAQRFRVEVSGVPKEWARIDRPDLEIAAENHADVIINFKPRRRSDSAPGNYAVQIAVYPKNNPEVRLKGSVTLTVLPYGGFGIALERNRLKSGERFRLHLHNQGNAPLPINLIARDLGDSLTFAIPNTHVTLAPDQHVAIQGQAKPRATRFFGDPREHTFDLIARSGDAAAFTIATRAHIDEKPALPSWAAFALIGVAAIILITIVLGLAVLLQPAPPQPAITSFQVNATRLAQGEPLVVNWSVADADEVAITINGAAIDLDPGAQNAQIDTSSLHGLVTVVLRASSGSRETETSETVQVFEPIAVSYFRADPSQLVLYVAQTVTLSWSAPGAESTTILGLENFTSAPLDPAYGEAASVAVVGIPRGPLTLTLMAQNEDTTVQQPLRIEAIAPQCTASSADASLRASPDAGDQVVATIPQGTTVVVDAQDAQGQWLRVQLSGGAHGWGERTAFECADNFSIDDLYKELIVPTALPEFTIVPTLTTPLPPTDAPTLLPATATVPAATTAPTFTRTPTPAPTQG